MTPVSVFNYRDARVFLGAWFTHQQRLDPKLSVRVWAKKMGISHALLVMLMNGKRPLLVRHASAIGQGMDLSTPERHFLQSLIELANAETDEERNQIEAWLENMNPGGAFRVRELEDAQINAGWVHFAILALLDSKHPIRDVDSVAPWFEHLVPKAEIFSAFQRLFNQGLISRDLTGRFRTKFGRVTSKDSAPNPAVRKYHSEVALLGSAAVHAQSQAEREFQSFAIAIDPSRIPVAKEMIRNFRTEFCKAMDCESSSAVYQATIQFFRLSQPAADSAGEPVLEKSHA